MKAPNPQRRAARTVLLAVHRMPVEGKKTAQLKQEFAARFGAAASNALVCQHFARDVIDTALARVSVLNNLVHLLLKAQVRQ